MSEALISEKVATSESQQKRQGPLGRLFKKYNAEPYWGGSVEQLVFILAALGMSVWGNVFGLGFIVFVALTTHVFPLYKLYKTKKEIDKKSDKDFQIRFKEELHIEADFSKEKAARRAQNSYFDNMIYLFHALHYVLLFTCIYVVGAMESYSAGLILALVLGLYYAPIAESYSHDFVHRRNLFQQMLGGSVWASYCYGTFLPEHCMGHHVHVSTPEDASSARKGQTIYQFLPNAVVQNVLAGFRLEAKRLRDRGRSVWSIRNRLIWLSLFSLSLIYASWLISGSYGLFFFAAFTVGGVITIEVANYVMHYGLERKKLANGRYERVSPLHSWNREGFLNFLVVNLMRHSDHHAFPRRPYQNLRNFPEAPELPLPYELTLFMPYFPKLWFKVMDPRVDEHMAKLEAWRENNVDDYKMVMGIDAERIKN